MSHSYSSEGISQALEETDLRATIEAILDDPNGLAGDPDNHNLWNVYQVTDTQDRRELTVKRDGVYLRASREVRTDERALNPKRKVTTLHALADVAGVRASTLIDDGIVRLADYRDESVPSLTSTGGPNANALRRAAETIEFAIESLSS